jgi:hypothetical protein
MVGIKINIINQNAQYKHKNKKKTKIKITGLSFMGSRTTLNLMCITYTMV